MSLYSAFERKMQKTKIGSYFLFQIKSLLFPSRKFENSKQYWEKRYRSGGASGSGSYNNLALYKAEILNAFIKDNDVKSVVELGCGDGNQLQLLELNSYIGYDVSDAVVDICRNKFADDNTKKFYNIAEFKFQDVDLAISLDVIYHLVEDDVFDEYMNMLFDASSKYVIIYSSNFDDNNHNPLYKHVKHRMFTLWVEHNRPEYELLSYIPNKYPFDETRMDTTSLADFYIYKKR
jgi:SAM-dependent methyltransferase